jgi:hypothetical protein
MSCERQILSDRILLAINEFNEVMYHQYFIGKFIIAIYLLMIFSLVYINDLLGIVALIIASFYCSIALKCNLPEIFSYSPSMAGYVNCIFMGSSLNNTHSVEDMNNLINGVYNEVPYDELMATIFTYLQSMDDESDEAFRSTSRKIN